MNSSQCVLEKKFPLVHRKLAVVSTDRFTEARCVLHTHTHTHTCRSVLFWSSILLFFDFSSSYFLSLSFLSFVSLHLYVILHITFPFLFLYLYSFLCVFCPFFFLLFYLSLFHFLAHLRRINSLFHSAYLRALDPGTVYAWHQSLSSFFTSFSDPVFLSFLVLPFFQSPSEIRMLPHRKKL